MTKEFDIFLLDDQHVLDQSEMRVEQWLKYCEHWNWTLSWNKHYHLQMLRTIYTATKKLRL